MVTDEQSRSALEEKLALLPAQPGCYLFSDAKGAVLYVGKAKSLRSRVRSYFQDGSSDVRAFIPHLRRHATNVETIVTATEKEAAILENSLIKERRPRFNVKLRDDKEYLSLKLALEHPFPRLELVRKPKKDGSRYFGPYHSATSARRTLNVVEKHFKLRTCTDRELGSRKRPCLQFQIQRCLAPCVYEIDRELYGQQVHSVGLFLDGRHDELSRELDERMKAASHNLEFELAATYRDQLAAVGSAREAQRVVLVTDRDQDVLGIYRQGDLVELCVMVVRQGRVVDRLAFSSKNVELPDDEVVANFVREHYGEGGSGEAHVPDEVLVPVLPEGADGVAEWLTERRFAIAERRAKVELLAPARGPKRALLEMALSNAQHGFEEKRRAKDDIDARLAKVQEKLRLPTLPRRIECCDISHLGGNDTVGAVVALENGAPDKKRYRSYIVRSVGEGDDYGAMYEVLSRRFRRGKAAAASAAKSTPSDVRHSLESAASALGEPAPIAREADENVTTAAGIAFEAAESVIDPVETEEGRIEADLALETEISRGVEDGVSEPAHAVLDAAEGAPQSADIVLVLEDGVIEAADISLEAAGDAVDWQLPDLFVVDGGRGQLGVALAAARDLGLHALSIVGLAKEKENVLGDKLVDRVYLPGQKNPIPLRPNSPELFILARARDEAHRFSNRGRTKVGKRRRFESELDRVPGIGPKTRVALLKTLGSVASLREASDDAILAVPGVTRRHLAALRAVFVRADPSEVSEAET